jgi:hypothetical protein
MNLSPVVVKFRPAWKRLGYRFGRRVPVYVPRPRFAEVLERDPVPAEMVPALSDADLDRLRTPQDSGAFPLPGGPDPASFRDRR